MSLTRRAILFAGFTAAILLGCAPIVRRLVGFSLADASASHLLVVPVIAAVLMIWHRQAIFAAPTSAPRSGLVVILAGVAITLAAISNGLTETALRPAVAGMVAMWMGGFVLFFGRRVVRAAAFPLVFVAFVIPIPAVLLSGLTEILKIGSTEVVAGLFALTGIPHHREGFIFTLPSVAIHIADECSGIRSTIGLMLTALLAGYQFLQSPWKRALLLLAVVPITILKNAVRIVSLSLLATYVDPSFLSGRLHTDGGVVFFLMALALMWPVLMILRRPDAGGGALRSRPSLSV